MLLLLAISLGLALGQLAPRVAQTIRPLGDLFLNLIFTLIVPLTFFTISSSIASSASAQRIGRISRRMMLGFLITSIVAASLSLAFLLAWHPAQGIDAAALLLGKGKAALPSAPALLPQLVAMVSVSDFSELLSRKSMLPLLLFSLAVGLCARSMRSQAEPLIRFLQSGAAVFLRLLDYVMYLAPLGLFAWFAATVMDTGSQLAGIYFRSFVGYYAFSALYFVAGFSAYVYLSGGLRSVRLFWSQMLEPSLTALGTCSSMATMPVNLEACTRMGIAAEVRDVVIPVGAVLHKDGSVIGGVLKILFAMSLFQQSLSPGRCAMIILVAILVGVVMGAIPSGGMMGELLILSVFGFPPETLPLLAIISILIDPMATLLNAVGDNVVALWVMQATASDRESDRESDRALDRESDRALDRESDTVRTSETTSTSQHE